MSSDSTATVVTARKGVLLLPSGRKAFPYWNRPMGQRSFCHAQQQVPVLGARSPRRHRCGRDRSRFTSLGSTIVEKKTRLPTRHP